MRGHIRKRGVGYQITIEMERDPITKKRKQKSVSGFKTKKEAEIALADLITQVEKGEYFETENMCLKEYLDHWLETYVKVSVSLSTQIRYKEFCVTISKHIGKVSLKQLKPNVIQNFYSNLIDEGRLAKSTILKMHRMLHLALKHAVGWQMINNNPAVNVTAPKPEHVEMKVWDADTVKLFLEKIKNDAIYIPVLIAVTTGMRQGEICALKWDNINFKTESISVKHTLQKYKKEFILNQPKTKKSIRTIDMMALTIKELKEHRKNQLEMIMLFRHEYNDENYVCAWNDGRPYDPHYVSKKFADTVDDIYMNENKKIKFPKIRFHDLRHTHATLMLQQGINPKIVSERLGHSQIGITLDTYSHVLPNMQKEAVEKLNAVF